MHEFDVAHHHYTCVVRKSRLVLLVTMDDPLTYVNGNDNIREGTGDNPVDLDSLRQYLRQYTYIKFNADGWFDRLLYALPVSGMLQQQMQQQQQQQQHNPLIQENHDEQITAGTSHDDDPLLINVI
jgi:hypothetical protein